MLTLGLKKEKCLKNSLCKGIILTLCKDRSASQGSWVAEGREEAVDYQERQRFLEEESELGDLLSLGLGLYCSSVALFLSDFPSQ